MTHFEIWYAVKNSNSYNHFKKKREDFDNLLIIEGADYQGVVELAVSQLFGAKKSPYVALVKDYKIESIMDWALAQHLYEDWSEIIPVILKPITRCQRCGIANISDVFHWSYKNQPTTHEQVLAKVCIPTAGHGDKQDIPCLAKQLHEADLGLLQKTPAELHDFVRANNNAIEFELPDEDYYLEMAKEILDEQV
jgi:hypothetical protein